MSERQIKAVKGRGSLPKPAVTMQQAGKETRGKCIDSKHHFQKTKTSTEYFTHWTSAVTFI